VFLVWKMWSVLEVRPDSYTAHALGCLHHAFSDRPSQCSQGVNRAPSSHTATMAKHRRPQCSAEGYLGPLCGRDSNKKLVRLSWSECAQTRSIQATCDPLSTSSCSTVTCTCPTSRRVGTWRTAFSFPQILEHGARAATGSSPWCLGSYLDFLVWPSAPTPPQTPGASAGPVLCFCRWATRSISAPEVSERSADSPHAQSHNPWQFR